MSTASIARESGSVEVAAPSLRDLVQGADRLPALPTLLVELLQSFGDERSDLGRLAGKIARDQALVVKVLRLANSSFYGMPQQVGSVREAMVVLGFDQVRNLVIAAGLIPAFPKGRHGGLDISSFWRHGMEVAVRSRALARDNARELAFTAGLLHDIGKLVLATAAPAHSRMVAEYQLAHTGNTGNTGNTCDDRTAESAVLGYTHDQIGAEAARRWRLPAQICEAIEFNHDTGSASRPVLHPASHPLADAVHVADAWSILGEVDELVAPSVRRALARLEVTPDELKERAPECDQQIAALEGLIEA